MYVRTILPIGMLYTGSLVCSNLVYLYLSVAFTQMLKSAAPVAVLFTSWAWGVAEPSLAKFLNVVVIVIGVAIASFGEINFSLIGFLYQVAGIVFEAMRITMIQVMLSAEGMKMDPLVGLYYYAPVCAAFNILVALFSEVPDFKYQDLLDTGFSVLFLNALVAFLLNVASVFLVRYSPTLMPAPVSSNILLSDWQDLRPCPDPHRYLQVHPPRRRLHRHLADPRLPHPVPRLHHCHARPRLLLARLRPGLQALLQHHDLDNCHLWLLLCPRRLRPRLVL